MTPAVTPAEDAEPPTPGSPGAMAPSPDFAPAEARCLWQGLAVEVVPDWNERGCFGGIRGRVERVNLLPATQGP